MVFIVTQIFVLIAILIVLYLLTWFLPTDSPWSPWWSTSTEVSREIGRLARITKRDIFYELGSGTGTTIVTIVKEFGATAVGVESSKSRIWWSKMKAKKNNIPRDKVTFLRKDFFSVDLSPASVVYLYLVPRVITKLKKKLVKELKPGTRVISYIYPISYLPLVRHDKIQKIYVYKIKS